MTLKQNIEHSKLAIIWCYECELHGPNSLECKEIRLKMRKLRGINNNNSELSADERRKVLTGAAA